MNGFFLFLAVVCTLLALCAFLGVLKSFRHNRLIEDTPTSKTAAVFIGQVELKGTAESEFPLSSYLTNTPSVWYDWQVEEEWRKVGKVTTKNAKGETVTEDRVTDSGWSKVAGERVAQPFYLKDDSGVIRIIPDKAAIEPKTTFSKTCSASDRIYYGLGPRDSVPHSTGTRRFTETIIPLHHEIFVAGRSRVRDDVTAAEIAYDKLSPLFLISVLSEEEILSQRKAAYVGSAFFFLLFAGLAGGLFLGGKTEGLYTVCGAIGVLVLNWVWQVHRHTVELRNRALQARSNVDVELKRRHDLIGRLVEVVKEYRAYEEELLKEVTDLRAQMEVASLDDAAKRSGTIAPAGKIAAAVVEKFPDLKSNDLFLNLQKNLVETEERIALAKAYYNDTVQYVNTRRETIPDGPIARLSGLKEMDYFETEQFERAAVEVHLQ